MFTIKVEKRERNEEFSFESILKSAEVVHEDCYGGKANFKWIVGDDYDYWRCACERCDAVAQIRGDEEKVKLEIVQTAIDGKERQLNDNVRVIQKP
jgi:hypothetical protein